METIDVQSWEEFEQKLAELERQRMARNSEIGSHVAEFLFRGHENHEWKLTTTLERESPVRSISEYYRRAFVASHEISAFTKRNWNLPKPPRYQELTKDFDGSSFGKRPGYDYLAYLRHHGFPSPLLDWSQSPYIAAFFAFRRKLAGVERVAVFVYNERWGIGKGWSSNEPSIHSWGPYVRTHPRHFLQQCVYTTCVIRTDNGPCYANHEDVFADPEPWKDQDRLWKITLPQSERPKALARLNAVNINAFSLFQSDDALVETMATREFVLRGLLRGEE